MSRFAYVLTVLVLLAGCTLHEPVQISVPEPPDRFLQDPLDRPASVKAEKWWLSFQDEKLNSLIAELFSQNLELAQMFARLEQIEAISDISQSARYPFLGTTGNASYSKQPGLNGDFEGESAQLSLQAGYEVDLWGKLAKQSYASELDYVASQKELQSMMLGLSAHLADLYFLATEKRAQIALVDQLITSFGETVELVETRYRNGLTGAVDLYQSRQSLSAAKASKSLYEGSLAEAEHAINVLLGVYPVQDPDGEPSVLPTPPELFHVGIPAELLSRRPDLVAALKRVEAADKRVAAAIADRFPSISLSGNIGLLRQEVTGGLITGDFWSLLGNLALPIIDGGRRRTEVRRTEAVLAEAVATYKQKVLAAFQEVEDALANNYAHAERVKLLQETAVATGATLRLVSQRYLAGLTDYLPVLTAQRNEFEVRSRLLVAQRQLLSDRISLTRALGGTWMTGEINRKFQIEKDSK